MCGGGGAGVRVRRDVEGRKEGNKRKKISAFATLLVDNKEAVDKVN